MKQSPAEFNQPATCEIYQALVSYTKDRDISGKLNNPVLKFLRLKTLREKLKLLMRPPGKSVNADPESIASFRNVLVETKETADQWGGTLYFAYLSGYGALSHPGGQDPQRDMVLYMVDNLKIPLVDTMQRFLENENPTRNFPFQLGNHYNARGHKLVADAILESISNSLTELPSETDSHFGAPKVVFENEYKNIRNFCVLP